MITRHTLGKLSLVLFVAVTLLMVGAPLSQTTGPDVVYAQAPTPTPSGDPVWNAFSLARATLEEELERNIQYVRTWTWEDANFGEPLSDCRTLEEGEESTNATVGYRITITLLDGRQFVIRTRYDATYAVICDGVNQTGAPIAPAEGLPAPVAGPAGAGGLEVGGQVTGLFPDARDALNAAGMRWVKVQVRMGQPFDQISGIIQEAHSAGFKILLTALGDHNTIMDPAVQDSFAAWTGQIAAAGADAIEVWNEPNIDREWVTGQVSGGNYTQVLAKAYNAIKQNNQNTIVVSGATAPTGFFGAAGCNAQGCNDDVFYQQMAQAGAANYLDCVGVHYNEGIISPTRNSGDPRTPDYPTRYYQSNLVRALAPFPNKQACFTEIGYLTPEGYGALPAGFTWASETSVVEQAQWLGEAVSIARSQGNVRIMIVFNVDYTFYGDDPQGGYAIIRPDGSCPACSAIRAALGG